jgi:DNA-3-methyladenine glycosylase I
MTTRSPRLKPAAAPAPADAECPRCTWAQGVPDFYARYHDEEWGVPCFDERSMFEKMILEGAQAGLSWRTVLAKRNHYRKVFDGFDADTIARYTPRRIEALLADPGIIRNRAKVEATVHNARTLLGLRETASRPERALSDLYWSAVDGRPLQGARSRHNQVPATTSQSDALSKRLLKLGFKFVGSTTVYAHMQALGLVNDHLTTCYRHDAVQALGQAL